MRKIVLTNLKTETVAHCPVSPEEIHVTYTNNFGSYDIIGVGEVKFPDGLQLSTISWESFIERDVTPEMGYAIFDSTTDPDWWHNWFERTKIDGDRMRVMITDTPVCFDCYIDKFEANWKDTKMYYSIDFIQAKDIEVNVEALEFSYEQSVSYRVHIQDQGWQDTVYTGNVAGTTGQRLQMEAIEIKANLTGCSIEYRCHVRDTGWQDWVRDGQAAGTVGENRQIEAIQIRLVGDTADEYDVYYRLHIMDYGWLEWSNNGWENGTTGINHRAEAIQIVVCRKGEFQPSDMPADANFSYLNSNPLFLSQSKYFDQFLHQALPRNNSEKEKEDYRRYTVKDRDCLWYIAQQFYGDGEKWPTIYEANKDVIGGDPNIIHAGQELIIP